MDLQTLKSSSQVAAVGIIFTLAPIAFGWAQEMSVREMVQEDCKQELSDYCGTVTPSRGRIAACLFAHNDKLSEQCQLTFEIGVLQLTQILTTVSYVIEQCSDDIDQYCEDVVVGGDRLRQCLADHRDELASNCQEAFSYAEESLE